MTTTLTLPSGDIVNPETGEILVPVVVGIVGSRVYPDPDGVDAYVAALPPGSIVVSGGAVGVDTWAVEAAHRRADLTTRIYPADWAKHGKSAGFQRNLAIVRDVGKAGGRIVAFWAIDPKTGQPSKGTGIIVSLAEREGVPVEVIQPPPVPEIPPALAARIAELETAAKAYRCAPPSRRRETKERLWSLGTTLRQEIEHIAAWLNREWARLEAVYDTQREERWLGALRGYKAAYDALERAKESL